MANKTCTMPGCDAPFAAKGLCLRHYNYSYRQDRRAKLGLPPNPPKPSTTEPMRVFALRVTPEEHEKLKATAARMGVTISELMRSFIANLEEEAVAA